MCERLGKERPAAISCPVLRDDVVVWSSSMSSQDSAAPPTACPNDNNPAVMRYSICCQARVESWRGEVKWSVDNLRLQMSTWLLKSELCGRGVHFDLCTGSGIEISMNYEL